MTRHRYMSEPRDNDVFTACQKNVGAPPAENLSDDLIKTGETNPLVDTHRRDNPG
jgi:hypothetical protein